MQPESSGLQGDRRRSIESSTKGTDQVVSEQEREINPLVRIEMKLDALLYADSLAIARYRGMLAERDAQTLTALVRDEQPRW